MLKKPKRIVITGGPGAGKSTLLAALHARGYPCSTEAGRAIIQEQVDTGGNALPWGDRQAFAEQMLEWEVRSWQESMHSGSVYFFDRGIPDVAGYLTLCGLPLPKHLVAAIATYRYAKTIFIAPPWEAIFEQDAERKQTFAEAQQTYAVMQSIYRQYGYRLQVLPCTSVDARADFVLAHL